MSIVALVYIGHDVNHPRVPIPARRSVPARHRCASRPATGPSRPGRTVPPVNVSDRGKIDVEPDTLLRRCLIPCAQQRDCHGRARMQSELPENPFAVPPRRVRA
jgi:hypothetical protein